MSKINLNKKHTMCRKTTMLAGNTKSIVFFTFFSFDFRFQVIRRREQGKHSN